MKILYLSNSRLPTEKAYGIQIVKMCEAFAASGAEVLLLYPYRLSPHIKEGLFEYFSVKKEFKAKQLNTPDFYFPGSMDRVAFFIKSFISAVALVAYALFSDFDIIYSRDELPIFLLSFFTKKICFEAHKFSDMKGFYYRRFKFSKVKTVTITKALKEEFVKAGFDGSNILVAPDGVDIEEFDIDISKEDARRKTELPIDRNIVLYAGHLFEWKGANVLLEAARNFQFPISNFQKNKENILFVFVGGTDYDIKNFRKKGEGLTNVLIVGRKPHADMPVYLKAGDILALPNSGKEAISQKFTSPLKLFEYMASKRPIIASDLPALREILNDQNSVLVKSDDPKLLADAIRGILNNYKLTEELADRAFIDVQNYTWDKRSAKILNFI